MQVTSHLPGRTVIINGQERLYFSGTSYLGMSKHSVFQQQLLEGIARYGTHYGSSRSSNLQLAVYDKAEKLLAEIAGAAAALTFSSGYLAGQAAVQAVNQGQAFVYAPGTHPAVWRHARDAWHGDYAAWTAHLPAQWNKLRGAPAVVVANALDPLLARKHIFDWILQVPEAQPLTLLIDDSHGFGVTGDHGAGIYPQLRGLLKPKMQLIVVSSLGKAFGMPGGVVLGDTDFIRTLQKSPIFTAGSPVSPAYLEAFVQSQSLYQAARQQLSANVRYFQQKLAGSNLFRYFDEYPVFYTPRNTLAKVLENRCIISSFPYPDPNSQPITRVVLSSLHTHSDIDALCCLLPLRN